MRPKDNGKKVVGEIWIGEDPSAHFHPSFEWLQLSEEQSDVLGWFYDPIEKTFAQDTSLAVEHGPNPPEIDGFNVNIT